MGIFEGLKGFLISQSEGEAPGLQTRQEGKRQLLGSGPTKESPVLPVKRGRLLLGVDATASRDRAWNVSIKVTDTLFQAVPGRLDVGLAVHGGSRVHTYTRYFPNADKLRDRAAGIRCEAGYTRWLEIFSRATQETPVPEVIIAIADCFEESKSHASRLADKLKAQGTRVIFLQDGCDGEAADVFANIAARTGGAVLPFDASAVDKLRELLGAVAVLAVEGEKVLEEKQETLPGALLLLDGMKTAARLEGRKKK
jgi:hypothetical protein